MPTASLSSPSLSCKIAHGTLVFSLIAIVTFSLLDLSATLAFRTPWWLPLTVVQLLPILALGVLAAGGTSNAMPCETKRPGFAAIGVAVLWLGSLISALASPHRSEALVNVTGTLSMLAIGLSCAVLLAPNADGFGARLARLRLVVGWIFVALLVDSLARWTFQDLLPGIANGAAIRNAVGADAWQFSWENFRNLRPFGHPNYTAGAAVLMIPWLGMLAWETRGKARAGWAIATLFAGVLLFSSGSRGGLLGLAVAIGIGALLALWQGGRRLRMLAVLALLAGAVLAVANPRMRETLTGLSRTERVPSGSDLERRSMLEAGVHMGSDRWLTGWGAGTTPLVFPAYRGQLGVSLENSFQLHNQLVTAWAEGGALAVVGAGLLVIGLGVCARAALRSRGASVLFGKGPGTILATVIAAVLSLSGYGVLLLTDSQLDVAFFGAAVAVIAAVLWACGRATELAKKAEPETVARVDDVTTKRIHAHFPALRIAFAGVALASLGAIACATVPKARLRAQLATAFLDLDAERQDLFVDSLKSVARQFPNDFLVANLRAWADPRISREEWERSLAINPIQELPHTNLGWLLWKTESAVALAHFKAAAALVPDKRGAYFGQALAHLAARDPADLAIAALTQECLRNPDFVVSPLWQQEPFVRIWPPLSVRLRTELNRLAAAQARPAWVRAEAQDFLLLLDWQEGKRDVATIRTEFASEARRAYFGAFASAPAQPQAPLAKAAGVGAWELLARSPGNARTAYARMTGVVLPPDAPIVKAIEERLALGWPLKPAPGVAEPIRKVRYNRPGYAILMRNTDLPLMEDLHETERQDSVVFTEGLFPRKGWCLPLETETVALPDSSSRP